MDITKRQLGNILVFSLRGNLLGEPEGSMLREAIKAETEKGTEKIILDCADLNIMNSVGLGIIISTLTTLRRLGGELCLAKVNSKVEGVLVLTKIVNIVRSYDTVERAVEGMS